MTLNRLGLPLGTQHVLSIRGRKTGRWRSTPVSVLTVNGRRYVCTGLETDWVKNARAVGWGLLRRGRRTERVALVELPVEERAAVLREFPRQVPHGVNYFERILGLPNDPDAFAAAALRCPVFRFDPMPEEDQQHEPTLGRRPKTVQVPQNHLPAFPGQSVRRSSADCDLGDNRLVGRASGPPLTNDEPEDARAGHGPSMARPVGASRDIAASTTHVKPSVFRTLVAGVAGGATFWTATFLAFVLVGSGPLFDPAVQSPKLIAVWTELQPLPLFATAPYVVLLEYVLFATGYAFLLRSVAPAWPTGGWARTWRLATVIWGLSCAFFELLGPVNLLGEPPGLVALELGFWAVAALSESLVVVFLLRHHRRAELMAPAVLTRDSRLGGPAAEVAGQARAGGPTGPNGQTR